MKQSITVNYMDGRVAQGVIGPKEFIDFERKFGVSVQDLATAPHIEWVYYLAFLAMQRLSRAGEHPGPIKPSFDNFLDVIEDVELEDVDLAPLDETAS